MVQLESKTLEVRWAQDVKYADGSTKAEGCKAFMRCVPKLIPGLSVDPGNPSENEVTLAVSRYQMCIRDSPHAAHGRAAARPRGDLPARPLFPDQ